MRALLLAAVLGLLAIPAASASPVPTVRVLEAGGQIEAAAGSSFTYVAPYAFTPADGADLVDLTVRLAPTADLVLPSAVSFRPTAEAEYEALGNVAGAAKRELGSVAGGSYQFLVDADVPAGTPRGAYKVGLAVLARDPDSGRTSAGAVYALTLVVPNQAPLADFTVQANGLSVQVDADAAVDRDGDALSFHWTFGNGETATGERPAPHTYAAPGTYTIGLTATDSEGATAVAERSVTLTSSANTPPSGPPPNGAAPQDGESSTTTSTEPAGNTAANVPLDSDGDGTGDAAERAAGSDPANRASTPTDRDADGLANEQDNCPGASNPLQADRDGDRIGDACDTADDSPAADPDGDGQASADDNCPANANPTQADLDRDGHGDMCDTDRDGDGVVNGLDAFPDDATRYHAPTAAGGAVEPTAESGEAREPEKRDVAPWIFGAAGIAFGIAALAWASRQRQG